MKKAISLNVIREANKTVIGTSDYNKYYMMKESKIGGKWNYIGWYFVMFIMSMLIRIKRRYISEKKLGILTPLTFIFPILGSILLFVIMSIPQFICQLLNADCQYTRIIGFSVIIGFSLFYFIGVYINAKPSMKKTQSSIFFVFFLSYTYFAMFLIGLAFQILIYLGISLIHSSLILYLDLKTINFTNLMDKNN